MLSFAIPFAGPEVTPEAAAKVRADDLDLTATDTQDSKGGDRTATAEIGVESGDGLGLVPIAVASGGAVVTLATVVFVRRRRQPVP